MKRPDKCPVCGKDYIAEGAHDIRDSWQSLRLIIERCSFCHYPIYYICDSSAQSVYSQFPTSANIKISNEIKELSPKFFECYSDSMKALSHSLDSVVGAGLRKSLELLVTDYLIKIQNEQNINKLKLWEKIKLLDANLYATASANIARLIGNDYTHIENLSGAEIQELIDNIELTADLMTTRLKAIKAEERLKAIKANHANPQ